MKLKKILAGAMAVVMVAGTLLVAPVEAKAAPVVEKPTIEGIAWWDAANQQTESVALADGDTVVFTVEPQGDDIQFFVEATSPEVFCSSNSVNDCWGDGVVTDYPAADTTVYDKGNTYTATVSRVGQNVTIQYKNVTTDTVLRTHTFNATRLAADATVYMKAQVGKLSYSISRNNTAVEGSSIRGYDWWNNTALAKSVPVTLADGAKIVWTLDVNKNVGGEGAIYVVESTNTNGGVDFSSYFDCWGTNITDATTSYVTRDDSKIQQDKVYTVTLTREGDLFKVEHKNVTDNQVVATQSLKVTDCPETSEFYIYAQYGEISVSHEVPVKSLDVTGTNNKVVAGKNITLTATAFPVNTTDSTTVTWSSNKTDIATVDNTGKVTGVAEGTAVITAKISDTVLDTFEVTVQALSVPMTSVDVTADKTEIKVGQTATLSTTVAPVDTTDDKTITYTSSKPEVATVDATGKVTAVAPGKTTITASAVDGTITDTIDITVPEVKITEIKLEVEDKNLDKGDTVTITATINPTDTTDDKTITWTSSDEKVATVKNGVVTAVGGGNATIKAEVGGKSAEVTFNVTAVETVVKNTTIADLPAGEFLTSVTDGVEIKKNHTYTITFDYKSSAAATNNWNSPAYLIYTGSENKFNANEDYKELIYARADVWAWVLGIGDNNPDALPEGFKFDRTYPADWATWLAGVQNGGEGTLTLKWDGKVIKATFTIGDAISVAEVPLTSVPSGSKLYFSLTNELTTLSNINVADEYVKVTQGTMGDVNMMLPIACIILGGAVVLVASKKRFA